MSDEAEDTADELRVRLADAEDQRLRALADLDNLRKRCVTQVSRARAEASSTVAAEWLPVVDNLDRALSHSGAEPDSIIEGVTAVRDQALAILDGLGFGRRADAGEKFDPARHEAVAARADPSAEAGTVIEVVRPRYGEGDHQLRPAQVVVAQGPREPKGAVPSGLTSEARREGGALRAPGGEGGNPGPRERDQSGGEWG